jgi:hypothetical protein
VRLHDVAGDRQAKACPLAFGGEERIEHARANGFGDPDSSVFDVDDDAHSFGAHANVDRTSARHGLARVAQEIEQSLAELTFVE